VEASCESAGPDPHRCWDNVSPHVFRDCSNKLTATIISSSAAVRYGGSQLAIFHVPRKGYFATQQMCPHKRAFVLEHGIIGDDPNTGNIYVSCKFET
jgi:nitrite reductase/ring-hydroxylating ferredoxin subunit